jgi:hypothetical protein
VDPDSSNLTYEWDLDNDGQFDDATGRTVQHTWNGPYTGVIALKVTDDGCPPEHSREFWKGWDVTFTTVEVGNHAPICDPDGPYAAPPNATITLDGSGSHDIDPGDSIVRYEWDLDNDGSFDDSTAVRPSVVVGPIPGTLYVVCLRVTDTFGATNIACTTVTVVSCVQDLAARPKDGKIQLTWSAQNGVGSYNVYRGTVAHGPYTQIASNVVTTYCVYVDASVVNGTTYYYVVRPVSGGNEICQSNEASARATTRIR